MDSRMEYLPKLYISEDIEDITPIKWPKVNPYIVKKFEPHTICYFTTKEKENIMALSHLTKKELEEKVIELLENNEKLALLVKGKENTIERLARITEVLRNENNDLYATLGNKYHRVMELEDENKRLTNEIQDMNMNLNMNYVHELEEKVKRAEGSKHEWELVAKSLNDDVATLKKRVTELIENNNKLGEDNKRLTNEIQDITGMSRARIKELVKKNDELVKFGEAFQDRINELVKKNDELEEELEKEREDKSCIEKCYDGALSNNDILKLENEKLIGENRYLVLEVNDLRRKLEEKGYIDTDIASTNSIAEAFKAVADSAAAAGCKLKLALNSLYGDPYKAYANHIAAKVKALEDAGLSHDDAMGLIPLWDDEI